MQIHQAAARGDREAVERQLARGVPVDAPDHADDACTPLMCATRDPRAGLEMISLLLARGADPNAASARTGHTPLRLAAGRGSLAIVGRLLQAGARADAVSSRGYTALHDAMRAGGPEALAIARLLLDAGADPNGVTSYGESPLRDASRRGDTAAVALLLRAGADSEQLQWGRLHRAAALGTAETVAEALAGAGDLRARDWWDRTPFLVALTHGDAARAAALLRAGARLDECGRCGGPAASHCCPADRAETLRWLLAEGADPDATDDFGRTPLMGAAEAGAAACVRVLLAAGVDPNARDRSGSMALDAASTPEVLRLLAAAGSALDHVDPTGYSVLKSAAENGGLELARAALELGANPNTTRTGDTPLHMATAHDQLAIARLLLDAGADPNARDVDGCTPLHFARTPEAVRMLLAAGADPAAREEGGSTPLGTVRDPEAIALLIAAGGPLATGPDGRPAIVDAASAGSREAVEALLAAGADPNAVAFGQSALMLAAEAGSTECIHALNGAGADLECRDPRGRTALFYAAAPEAFAACQAALAIGAIDIRRIAFEQTGVTLPEGLEGEATSLLSRDAYWNGADTGPVRALVEAGARVEARDRGRATPLLLAASCGHPERVHALLQAGASVRARDLRGRTVLSLARRHPSAERRAEITALLTRFGAR
ncbi:MAG: ankyrin repeat domain-containing protein [Chthonomonadales bacterium]|nr:ankyrin repeat domain-containing protein [Chthonomonadales bacterium]